jgi:iron complex transport system ATP-binding protein
MTALRLERVSVELGRTRVLTDVSATVADGEWVALVGANGAGKTTLLRAIAGLVPYRGSIAIHGRAAGELDRRERARAVAVVPQQPTTPEWLTVGEYVLLGRTPHLGLLQGESRGDLAAAEQALSRLDLGSFAERRLGTLSGGERQRAVVARALAQEPSVILLDEPTAALDIGHQQQAFDLLDRLRAESGLTLVAAMHDLTLAAQYADRILLLHQGAIVADGAPADVITEEALSLYFDASVRVISVDGSPAVVPARAAGVAGPR